MQNPYLFSPSVTYRHSWASGFLRGFAHPYGGAEPPYDVPAADRDVYAEGFQAGIHAGIDGIEPGLHCVSAAEPDVGAWISGGGWGAWTVGGLLVGPGGLVAMLARGLLSILRIGWSGKHALPVEQVLPDVAAPLLAVLQEYGVDNVAIYAGVGVDPLAAGCEIQISGFFSSFDNARMAVDQMGRRNWAVIEWRNDMSNSMRIVEYAGEI